MVLGQLSDPIWVGGNRRQRGVRVPLSGPLHRCVHAGSWALRPARIAAFGWLSKLASGWCCSQPLGGQPSKVPRSEKSLLERGRVVRSVCSDSVLWLQKSAGVVGLRKAISVAAEFGGRSLAFWRSALRAKRRLDLGYPFGWCSERSEKGCLLAEGVSGHGSSRPSRVEGGRGLGLAVRSVLALASAKRQGRQSFGALASVAVKSCYGRGRLPGEAARVT